MKKEEVILGKNYYGNFIDNDDRLVEFIFTPIEYVSEIDCMEGGIKAGVRVNNLIDSDGWYVSDTHIVFDSIQREATKEEIEHYTSLAHVDMSILFKIFDR